MGNRKEPEKRVAYIGTDGLFKLWQEAMSMYNIAVKENHILYSIFQKDFVNSRKFHDSEESISMNDHQVNLGRIESLLIDRKDLVKKYSNYPLDQKTFSCCMKDFMIFDENDSSTLPDFECRLNRNVLTVLTEAINDIHVFKTDLSIKETEMLFNDCTVNPDVRLQASSNQVLSYFFNLLNYSSIISNRYQYVIASRKLVLTSTGKRFLSQADIANALCKFQSSEKPIRNKVDNWILVIKKALLESTEI